jgi:hypothetical protein
MKRCGMFTQIAFRLDKRARLEGRAFAVEVAFDFCAEILG